MLGEVVVPVPAIGVDDGARLDGTANEGDKAFSRHVIDTGQANSAETLGREHLDGDRHDRFLVCFAAVNAFFDAPNIGLIDFHYPMETVPSWPNHCRSELMQDGPGGLVAAK